MKAHSRHILSDSTIPVVACKKYLCDDAYLGSRFKGFAEDNQNDSPHSMWGRLHFL